MIRVLSLGAGVQSSTLALMGARGDIEPPDFAVFADTQAEPRSVYEWLDWLQDQLPFPIHRVTAGSLVERELTLRVSKKSGKTYRKTAIPAFGLNDNGSVGIMGRKCTQDHKIIPIIQELRRQCGIKRGEKQVKVEQWIGISLDEMQRMKDAREPWIQHRWPLIERRMTRLHCLEWMRDRKYPTPPRSACTFCPFHSDEEWRRVREVPDEWAQVVKFEKDMQAAAELDEALRAKPFLHKSCVPIDEAPIDAPPDNQVQFSFMDECDGMCGV